MRTSILIVDDEPLHRLAMREIILDLTASIFASPEAVDLYEAGTGREALRIVAEASIDLVILDVKLPVLDGLEISRLIRSQTPPPAPNVIVATAYSGYTERAYACGADAVLLKPVDERALADALESLLKGSLNQRPALSFWGEDQALGDEDIRRVLAYMEERYGERLSVARLAKVAHMSVSHFIRRFKSVTGVTPNDHLKSIRIRHARRTLLSSDLPINEIALQCGFQSVSYFSQLFRRHTGMTPTEWRMARPNVAGPP